MDIHLTPIGVVRTCFKEKFGIPRQPNLVATAKGTLVFHPAFARQEAVRALDGFSHIWLIFLFHEAVGKQDHWSPMVRPPRLGGNKKVGVFASRSPFRPNPIGMSCVRLDGIDLTDQGPQLKLSGVDLLDNTPVLDIKPYLPYSDAIPDARDGFAQGPPRPRLLVTFTPSARQRLEEKKRESPDLETLIQDLLAQDPRPAYTDRVDPERIYGIRLFDLDVKWTMDKDAAQAIVVDIVGV